MKPSNTVVGIDLGTTYSCVAIVNETTNEPEVITNNFGRNITPSVVAYNSKNGQILVGETAVNADIEPTNVIYDAKRFIGRQFNDTSVQNDRKLWPFEIVDKEGKPHVKRRQKNKDMLIPPESVSSEILKSMKAVADHYLNCQIAGAVITVPAYFDHRQRAETMKAAELAGIKVLRLINEPTAAAIAYGQQDELEGKTILIYDLGGGTFDVSIVRVNQNLKVIAVQGHPHLGGQDFDRLIMDYVMKTYREKTNKEFPKDKPKLIRRLKRACLEAKETLSFREQPATIHIEINADDDFHCELKREKLNEMIGGMLRGTIDIVDQALQQAEIDETAIDFVLLIGGSTRIPLVAELLAKKFTKDKLRHRINPEEAVALGAAILAHDLNKFPESIQNNVKIKNKQPPYDTNPTPTSGRHNYTLDISEIIPLSIGLELRGNKMLKIIERGTKYPCRIEEDLSTAYDNQRGSYSGIYMGERASVENCRKFGEIALRFDNTNTRRGYPLHVVYDIDINGILNVTKTEVATSKEAKIELKYDGKEQSDADIKRIVQEAEEHKQEDDKFLELIDKRDQFEDTIYSVKRNFEEQTGEQNKKKSQIVGQYLRWSDGLPLEITAYDAKLDQFFKDIEKC